MNPRRMCERCGGWYLAEDGFCVCEEMTDDQLEQQREAEAEAAIDEYERSLEPDDDAADRAADAWERYHHGGDE